MITLQKFIINSKLDHTTGIKDDDSKLIMLWSPKSGCTISIAMMLNYMKIDHDLLKLRYNIHGYIHSTFFKKYGHVNIDEDLLSKKYFVFKVIRNPYDRAVSSYLYTLRVCSKDHLKKLSFEDFLKNIKFNNGLFIDNNCINHIISYHICPQYIKNEENYINKYVHLETMEKDIDEINKLCNINLNTNIDCGFMKHHTQHSKIPDNSNIIYLGNISFNELPYIPSYYKYFYNDITKQLVDEIYPDDITNYNYKFYD